MSDEIKFSDKYDPLFRLLDGYFPEVDIVLISGGRDSGKTFATTCFLPTAAADYNHRILFTRYTMSSTSNSITKALDSRLELLGLSDDFNFANNEYTSKHNKGLLSITGQKTSSGEQTAKLKSLEGYSIFVTEEGEELNDYDDWEKIKRSVRATDVRCLSIIVFNPPTKDHMLYNQFYQGIPDGFNGIRGNIMYIHTTYRDNGKENMAPHNWNEYERLREVYEMFSKLTKEEQDKLPKKVIKDAKNYKNTIAGSFRDTAEGVIFDYEIGAFNPDNLPSTFGMDFGFVDPTTLVEVALDRKNNKAYLKQHIYKSGVLIEDIQDQIKTIAKLNLIIADAAKIDDISRLEALGLNIEKCYKGGGLNGSSVVAGIKSMLKWDLIVDPDSLDLIDELNNYCWDKRKIEYPIDKKNHAIDPVRYIIYDDELNPTQTLCIS